VERWLLDGQRHPADRIGVGLALNFLRRARRRAEAENDVRPFEGTRGPRLVRERAEPAGRSL
jgi:hypothetical protein